MTKISKLIDRFKAFPKDFTWDELVYLLKRLGFEESQDRGSRVKFYNEKLNCFVQLHKPHPKKIIKPYMIKKIMKILLQEKLI